MNTKHTSLATTVSLGVNASKEISYPPSVKNYLSQFIKLALAGSVLTSGIASAALQDFGGTADNSGVTVNGQALPATTLGWPAWYRDKDGLPVGLCKSQAPSPTLGAGAPMCFPLTTLSTAFAGNVGDEIFYTNLSANIANGGIDLLYETALEAAYGTTGAPVKGDEVVFTRVRFVMGVTGAECAGTYRIIHPWGDETFEDVPVGPRALVQTVDVGIGTLGFAGALEKPLGPFLHWDGNGDEIQSPHIQVGSEQFVGDPNVEHTFTGSPFIETLADGVTPRYHLLNGSPQHQNYVKVIAPAGCNIGGTPAPAGEGINIQKQPLAALMGQVWTTPIPTPTTVTQATFTRTATNTTVDVWAQTVKTPAQTLQVTGNNFPGAVMTAVTDNGAATGKYHAHLVLPVNTVLPSTISVVNSTTATVSKAVANLTDIVHINKAEYNPQTGMLCVSAQSSDNQSLTVEPGDFAAVPLDATTKSGCSLGTPNELSAFTQMPVAGSLDPNRAPNKVRVVSQLTGSAEKQVTVLANTPDNTATLVANADTFLNVSGSGAQILDVGANDGATGTGNQTGEIVIVDQPTDAQGKIVGTATGSLTGGSATFTANPGANGIVTFSYLVKNGVNVSNLVNATADVIFVAAAPTANPDNFAVLRTNNTIGYTAKVLENDVAGAGTTIDVASVQVINASNVKGATVNTGKGVVTANANGTVTYKPNVGATAGNDSFSYTVKNTLGTESTPVTVTVVVEGTQETISYNRNRYTGGAWSIKFATNWFGAPLTPTGSCYLVKVGTTTIPTPRFIGSIVADATGTFQIAATGTKAYNSPTYTATDVPTIPNGSYTIRCGTSNAATPLPAASAQTADNTTSTK